jgi:PPOX class probable F420-dependent enzyme
MQTAKIRETLDALERQRTVLLTTYRKDGTPVGTPVNIVVRGEHAYFRTYDRAYKTKRLARNPQVEIAPSTYGGKVTGPAVHGRVRLLTEEEAKPIRRLLARKHRLQQGIAVPLLHRVKRYKTLHYELTLDD